MDALRKALRALSVFYAVVFFTFALLHAGITLGQLREPVIIPAVVAETLCGLALLGGAYRSRASWDPLLYSHAFALAGVLLGVLSLGLGAAPATALDTWYHRVMAALLGLGLSGALYVSRVRR
ncbi:hypothetical protein ACIBHX_00335 [Nonomuraea sp. NPDC050536]|uniref:hypothetical protein n=1 Tax=Nonomuraea sp. NPDC050536 TaxID=3364366 RepID=UPI0037C7692E